METEKSPGRSTTAHPVLSAYLLPAALICLLSGYRVEKLTHGVARGAHRRYWPHC